MECGMALFDFRYKAEIYRNVSFSITEKMPQNVLFYIETGISLQ